MRRRAVTSCRSCRKIPIEPIVVDLKRQVLVIEGIAVGMIRSGKTL